jgi:cytochrome P450
MSSSTFVYDPTTSDFQENLPDVYRTLRDRFPVYHGTDYDGDDYYVLSRFEDVWTALHDTQTFSNRQVKEAERMKPMLVYMDPPVHTAHRNLVARAFNPRRIADLEPKVRSVVNSVLDRCVQSPTCEFQHEFAAIVPSIVVGDLIGVPEEHQDTFRVWCEDFLTFTETGEDPATKIYGLFDELLKERARAPQDDLMSALLAAEIDGERLNRDDLLGFCLLLILGGLDTTTNLMAGGLELLGRHPDQRAKLAANPAMMANAVEEMLRVVSPTQALPRGTTRDVTLHDVTIPAGSRVSIIFASANLDEREFDDPDAFDIERKITRHVAFGHGIHFCLGAPLARMETRIALDEILRRYPHYEVDRAVRLRSSWARAFEELVVRFDPA